MSAGIITNFTCLIMHRVLMLPRAKSWKNYSRSIISKLRSEIPTQNGTHIRACLIYCVRQAAKQFGCQIRKRGRAGRLYSAQVDLSKFTTIRSSRITLSSEVKGCDEKLLPLLDEALPQGAHKNFYVIHLMGLI